MPEPKWLGIARAELGQHEVAGSGANARIVEYLATTTFPSTSDETPWCSAFVNWALKQAGINGTRSAAAKSWLNWGIPVDAKPGAICVIKRKTSGTDQATGSSSGYHVGFWLAQDSESVRLLGGNRGDSVSESGFKLKSYEVLATRWPILEHNG